MGNVLSLFLCGVCITIVRREPPIGETKLLNSETILQKLENYEAASAPRNLM